jgi:hypothetical protein
MCVRVMFALAGLDDGSNDQFRGGEYVRWSLLAEPGMV